MSRGAPIAIVGMAGTFAGAADIGAYWHAILHELDCITDVPPTHWAIEDHYDPDPAAPDKTYSKRGGFLPAMAFDPLAFGLPPNILELTDVAQLLTLVVASRALADAGFGAVNPHAERTGVVLGVSALSLVGPLSARLQDPIWRRVLRSRGVAEGEIDGIVGAIKRAYVQWREDSFPGYLSNVVPGRVANRLNLRGINCAVDAACASSLASIRLAAHELRTGDCDVMLAGGVDTNNTPMGFVSFSKTPAFTPGDHMRPFDAASDGMLIGEGVGVVVLRRLADAERDGQRIYAVIRGIGASSDGRSGSVYAPRREGQELALRRAYDDAGVPPASVGLLEAHGTGTPTGDATELAALQAVFADAVEPIALGSVKAQIGHTKVAAGVASLIKAALALHQKVLPPTINVATPHPGVRPPFYLNTRARPWFAAAPRRAGVSSFGFGGTNFHVVLEEHDAARADGPRLHPTLFALFLHAPDTGALAASCARVAGELRSEAGAFRSLVETSKREGIPGDAARVGFLAATREEAIERLGEIATALSSGPVAGGSGDPALPAGIHFRERGMDARVVLLFPGQGSQRVGMGTSLCANFPPVREAFERMDAILAARGLPPITRVVYPPPTFEAGERDAQARQLRATNHAQAAIGALNLGLFALLRRCGLLPDFVAGHSLGELAALHAGAALAEDDYLSLLVARGEAMACPPPEGVDPGSLLAVGGDGEMLEELLREHAGVSVANRNSPSQLVVAGSRDDLAALKAELAALGVPATPLPVSGAFHSPHVAHARAPFARALEGIRLSAPRIPTYANTTAAPYPLSDAAARELLAEQLVRPVEFRRMIEAIHDAGGRVFVECGPGRVLTGLVGDILVGRPHVAVALNRTFGDDDDRSLRDAYVRLRVAGVELDDLDPWQPLPEVPANERGPVVRICGAAYRSEPTELAFEQALTGAPEGSMTEKDTRSNVARAVTSGDPSAEAHLRYLENLADHSARYFELTRQLYTLATDPACPPAALASFERAVSSFHELQLAAQHVHAQFLGMRVEAPSPKPPSPAAVPSPPAPSPSPPAPSPSSAKPPPASTSVMNGTPAVAAPVKPVPDGTSRNGAPTNGAPPHGASPNGTSRPQALLPPAPSSAPASSPVDDADDIAAILMAVISDKTGYPLASLEAGMDVDADLGIDSLKRVEIMAALEGRLFKSLSGIDFSSFSTRRTISDIARFLAEAR